MPSFKRYAACAAALIAGLSVAACSALPDASEFKPMQEPAYNMTQSSQVLECVGHLIDTSSGGGIDVFISDVPDHTVPSIESGFLAKNAVMMVKTAIDRLGTEKIQVIGREGGSPERRQVQLIGSFTELNRTTASRAVSGEFIFPGGVSLDLGHDISFNHIALDTALSEFNRIIPRTGTSVSIQIHGDSGNATVTYDEGEDFAASVGGGFTAQEGFHAAQRLLVETAVARMFSKYYGVDLSACLQNVREPGARPFVGRYDSLFYVPPPAPRQYRPVLMIMDGPPPPVGTPPRYDIPALMPVPAPVAVPMSAPLEVPPPASASAPPLTVVPQPLSASQSPPVLLTPYSGTSAAEPYVLLPQAGSAPRVLTQPPAEFTVPQPLNYSGATRTPPPTGFYDSQAGRRRSWEDR